MTFRKYVGDAYHQQKKGFLKIMASPNDIILISNDGIVPIYQKPSKKHPAFWGVAQFMDTVPSVLVGTVQLSGRETHRYIFDIWDMGIW